MLAAIGFVACSSPWFPIIGVNSYSPLRFLGEGLGVRALIRSCGVERYNKSVKRNLQSKKILQGCSWVAAAVMTVLSNGCRGGLSPQVIAAHKIADALPIALGPAQHYDVSVDGDLFPLMRGHAKHVHIAGTNVQVAPGMVMDSLTIDADDISFDMSKHQLENIAHTDFTGVIGQQNLSTYLAANKSQMHGLSVTLNRSDMLARIPVSIKSLVTIVALTGTISPSKQGATKVDFNATHTKVGWMPVPPFMTNMAMQRLNPIVDLTTLKIPIYLSQTQVVNRQLVLRGTAVIDQAHLGNITETASR